MATCSSRVETAPKSCSQISKLMCSSCRCNSSDLSLGWWARRDSGELRVRKRVGHVIEDSGPRSDARYGQSQVEADLSEVAAEGESGVEASLAESGNEAVATQGQDLEAWADAFDDLENLVEEDAGAVDEA
jgi:hypothetical protein